MHEYHCDADLTLDEFLDKNAAMQGWRREMADRDRRRPPIGRQVVAAVVALVVLMLLGVACCSKAGAAVPCYETPAAARAEWKHAHLWWHQVGDKRCWDNVRGKSKSAVHVKLPPLPKAAPVKSGTHTLTAEDSSLMPPVWPQLKASELVAAREGPITYERSVALLQFLFPLTWRPLQ